ncbi:MAG: NADP-dependent isocitrate dehydrogenase [Firmicutes bacterium]|nr:NADP-dependent isocitrate dehydrogenase [Bacillota bacterium]
MTKVKMTAPVVEMQGDEMTRVIWDWVKELLIEPFVDLKTDFYDLSLTNRDQTDDAVTFAAAEAIKKHRVGVKCATITANVQRLDEYKLKQMWPSPNGTIRAALDGTVFREPVVVKGIKPFIPGWKKPITIARHAYGDVYKDVEFETAPGDEVALVIKGKGEKTVHKFAGAGVTLAMHNTDASIASFAKACFEYALAKKQDLWFGTKDTISKLYDGRLKAIFERVSAEYADKFKAADIWYDYTLIDDSVSRVIKSGGGFIWALKNYDGDVMSDMVATAYGSLAMMTSVLVSPDGNYEYEAAHGTVTKHYYNHIKGMETSTNSVATIFAWSGGLKKSAELTRNKSLEKYAVALERAVIDTIERGTMTGDLVPLFVRRGITPVKVSTKAFIKAVAERM